MTVVDANMATTVIIRGHGLANVVIGIDDLCRLIVHIAATT